jgi:SAM-dependent methyltransferase
MTIYSGTFAKLYDRRFGHYAEKAAPHLLRFFASQPISRSCPHILDLGCGPGHLALRFLEAGYDFTGIDFSPAMLSLAEDRCRRYMVSGKARFSPGDISDFDLPGPFGWVVSTYNSINHLDSEQKLRSCFKSVRRCLAEGGFFLFDYHTQKGLAEWSSAEKAYFEEGPIEVTGSVEAGTGRATMRLKGSWVGKEFEEIIVNQAFPLKKLDQLLNGEGFKKITFSHIHEPGPALKEPEKETRLLVIAV